MAALASAMRSGLSSNNSLENGEPVSRPDVAPRSRLPTQTDKRPETMFLNETKTVPTRQFSMNENTMRAAEDQASSLATISPRVMMPPRRSEEPPIPARPTSEAFSDVAPSPPPISSKPRGSAATDGRPASLSYEFDPRAEAELLPARPRPLTGIETVSMPQISAKPRPSTWIDGEGKNIEGSSSSSPNMPRVSFTNGPPVLPRPLSRPGSVYSEEPKSTDSIDLPRKVGAGFVEKRHSIHDALFTNQNGMQPSSPVSSTVGSPSRVVKSLDILSPNTLDTLRSKEEEARYQLAMKATRSSPTKQSRPAQQVLGPGMLFL